MLVIGIILGFFGSIGQSLSYLPSRWYVTRKKQSVVQLLTLSHVMQGAVCLPLMIWFWPSDMPSLHVYWKPLLSSCLFYFVGQTGLFLALRHTDASRVSPLLGIKIALLAMLSIAFLSQHLTALQWLAVCLSILAAFVLNWSGGSVPFWAAVGLALACSGYAMSDFSIRVYIENVAPLSPLHAGLTGMYISYLFCGIVGLAFLPWYGSRDWHDWRDASPYAFLWLFAMVCLYCSIATLGLVLAAIIQSLRSLWSVVIGAILARRGYTGLEQRVAHGVLTRRLIGASMMVLAITLYVLPLAEHSAPSPDQPSTSAASVKPHATPMKPSIPIHQAKVPSNSLQ